MVAILSHPLGVISASLNYSTTCLRTALFCDVTQRRLVVYYRRFGTTCRSHLQGSGSPRINFLWDWYLVQKRQRCVRAQKNEDLTPRRKPEFILFMIKLNAVYFVLYTEHFNIRVYTAHVDKGASLEEYRFADGTVFTCVFGPIC